MVEDTTIEQILITGDLSALTPEQRLTHYNKVCALLGLNPLTQPFGYYEFEGAVQLYARKDATEQLRKLHAVSITELTSTDHNGVFVVTVKAIDGTGRTDMATGAVGTTFVKDGQVKSYSGKGLANQYMKAETKAKRRVTLSICGLGMLDESEIEDLPDQRPTQEVIKRNVAQATANATGEGTGTPEQIKAFDKAAAPPELGDTVVHIGKAEGNMLGRKVKELPDEILAWLQHKWVERLGPSATDQDYKLKNAVKHEVERRKAGLKTAQDAPEASTASADSTPPPSDHSRAVMLNDLRDKVEDMVMTPVQFCGYLQLAGLEFKGTRLEELSDGQLKFLLKSWDETKRVIERAMKPVVVEKPKKGRRKRT